MPEDHEDSLGGQQTFDGGAQEKSGPESLGDQHTFDGDATDPLSLGDELTIVGVGAGDDAFDDDMEIVDLESRYTIEGTLGKGGMGEVLLATDTRLKRKVAIKRVLGEMARSKTAVSRFLTEAQSIAALNHPNIVEIYDYGRTKDGPFLIMEFVDGNSLLDRCREGALPLDEAVDMTCQLCDGLGKAHDAGIIHRDIKPANVLLSKDGLPKLTDFGLARDNTADTGMTMAGAVLGTLDFMPPEQRRDASLTDAHSDLWSLAATLYQMVTGKSPKIIKFRDVPNTLQDVLEKALEDEQQERYQTAFEFRDALRESLSSKELTPLVEIDLGAGECPNCHTRNTENRKFCRECAGPLRVKCLQCENEIPIWDKVCGECGGKQAELVAARREEIDKSRAKAETLREEYAFVESLAIAKEIAAMDDVRMQDPVQQTKTFLAETESEQTRQEQSAANHYAEAKTHRAAFDYQSAIHAMESIPEPMRTTEMSAFLEQLGEERAESHQLIGTIADQIRRRDLDGLLDQVHRAVELQGDREDLRKLQTQLTERREKLIKKRDRAYAEAQRLLSQGDAKAALARIQPVKTGELRESDVALRDRLEKLVQEENELSALVKQCNADGVIDADEVEILYQKAAAYTKVNPHHAKIVKMKDDLIARMLKSPLLHANFLATIPAIISRIPSVRNSIGMELKLISAGQFRMGERDDSHLVTLTKAFYIGVHAVTQKQYEQVMGSNPSRFEGANHPVEKVSWEDAVVFCRRLSALRAEKASGRVYRLPTEAEWEYACRAGTTTEYSFGDDKSRLGKYAWYDGNSGGTTHAVGQLMPNPWGLYDMHGNVGEWCQDWYGDYSAGAGTDPRGPSSGSYRVSRGGSWFSTATGCRSSYRFRSDPPYRGYALGFRVACSPVK